MDPAEAKYMHTERHPGTLDVHPTQNILLLNYDIEVQILGEKENVLYGEKKKLQKIIELPMINSRTDCLSLAKEVVYQCDLIHHSRLAEVEQAIHYLKKRKINHTTNNCIAKNDLTKEEISKSTTSMTDEPNYNSLSEYIELLYEGMPEKIKGAYLIQLLARDSDNLDALSKNDILISALARVLREDWKRSIALSTHLVFTFFCFSMYSCFHNVILKCKVGSICMDIIEFEVQRYEQWCTSMDAPHLTTSLSGMVSVNRTKTICPPNSASMTEITSTRSRIPEPVRPRSGNFGNFNIANVPNPLSTTMKTLNNSKSGSGDGLESSIYESQSASMESVIDGLSQAEKMKRFRTLCKKQEHLLRVAIYLLLNIAEDETIEEKMTKRNIVSLLIKVLDRQNDELRVLAITFLKKLSIMQCNKETMMNLNIVDKIQKTFDSTNPDLVHLGLKLLFNLSFDAKLRSKMLRVGLVSKLCEFLADDRHQEVVIKLLYNLSYEDDTKTEFEECVGLIVDMLLLNIGNEGDEVMVALCINLSIQPLNAVHMLRNNRLQSIINRAFTYENSMLMKMVRNLSEHTDTWPNFVEFVGDIARAVIESKNVSFVVECVGILSNLRLDELDWTEIFRHFNVLEWMHAKFKETSHALDIELNLQLVVLLGTAAATDSDCALMICESDTLLLLIELLKSHQEDDEMVLQIGYVFLSLLAHKQSGRILIQNTEAPAYLIDLLQDNNKTIRQLANMCLNVIAHLDTGWAERIRIERFRNHNAHWLQMVDSSQLEQEELDAEDSDPDQLPPYLDMGHLSTATILNENNTLHENLFHLDKEEIAHEADEHEQNSTDENEGLLEEDVKNEVDVEDI